MATAPKPDLVVHEESLARLGDERAAGLARAVELGLRWYGDRVRLDRVSLSEPAWRTRAWASTATLSFTIDGVERQLRIAVPGLLDERAALTAAERGIPDRVGGFRGTYWEGRFRQPLVRYVRRPGIHRVVSPIADGSTYRGMVIGELGTGWILRYDREAGSDRLVIRSRLAPLATAERNSFDLDELLHSGVDSAEFGELRHTLTDPRRFEGEPLTDRQLHALIDWVASTRPGGTPTDAHPTMAERHWSTAGLGDVLAASVADGVARSARRAAADLDPDTGIDTDATIARLRAALVRAVDRVVRGTTSAFSSGVVTERPLNTLAALEAGRQRAFLGHGGLETYQGRLDLRVLPAEWRDQLCALQTQESAKIGFIRHAALRDWTGADPNGVAAAHADLSVAAALIPFLGHNDPTRSALGSKMLKQAVILDHAEPPLVRTGVEALVGETGATRSSAAGAARVDLDGGVARVGSSVLPVGSRAMFPALPGDGWVATAAEHVETGDVLAHAPDVVLEQGQPVLAYGLNATVAFLAWEGLNYEDGIVVSASFAERMSSTHVVRLSTPYDPVLGVAELLGADEADGLVTAGTPILTVRGDPDRMLAMPEDGVLLPVPDRSTAPTKRYTDLGDSDDYQHDANVAYRTTRPLQVGDKLTTRHGGKGVVTRIEPDERMPRLPDGRVVEVLLNPLGLIRRLNFGTVMELATGLDRVLEHGWDAPPPTIVPRRLGRAARLELAARLADRGAPGGRLPLRSAEGESIGPADGVMAGPLYLVKLDHLARAKGGSRDDAAASPVTFQPVSAAVWQGARRRSAPQRLGEMELWSLEAIGATRALDDLLAVRGVGESELRDDRTLLPAGLRAGLGYLAVAGVGFVSTGQWRGRLTARDITLDPATGEPHELVRAIWRGGDEAAGLLDVVDEFGDRAREELRQSMRASRTAGAAPEPAAGTLAAAILDLAIGSREPHTDRPDRGVGETPRYEIVLPEPVDHPWYVKTPAGFDYVVLPPLTRLAILPSSAFTGTPDPRRDPLRRRYRDILTWVILHRTSTDRATRARAVERIDAGVREFLGPLREPTTDAGRWASETIAGRVTGKFGLLRRNGLGAAAIRSGRAVLVGDPTLGPEEVRIPRWMAQDLGIDPERTNAGFGDVVIVNRQPTLHPYSLQALRARPWDESAVALHPILLAAIAGDFDGDTVAVHRLQSEAARQEIWELRRPAAALRSGASGSLLAKLDQDVQLGLVLAQGEGAAAEALAEAAIADRAQQTPAQREEALRAIADLQLAGLAAANRWGPSVVDLDPPTEEAALRGYLERAAPHLALGLACRAAGSFGSEGVRQWMLARGAAVSPVSEPDAPLVRGNYLDGIDDADYFAASQPAILGIAAKKLITPFAGTLTRRLVRQGYESVIASKNCFEDGRAHAIIDCLEIAGPCADAYGTNPETGLPVRVGDSVGIRAALFIGERGTQAALKSIHDRSGASVATARVHSSNPETMSGREKLRELAAILLRDGPDRGDGFGGGGGEFFLPAAVPALGDRYATLRGRLNTPVTFRAFRDRVVTTLFPELAETRELSHEAMRTIAEVLVARVSEILPSVDARHAAVLIRDRLLYLDPQSARPDGAPDGEVPTSALLPTSVWTGRVTALLLELGLPADRSADGTRLVARDPGARSVERTEREEHLTAGERLTATLRNSRGEAPHD